DGTYGVRLGDSFYRVDADLPATSSTATSPAFARLGAGGSVWVAVVEKAYASYRYGDSDYASLEGGWSVEVNQAFGASVDGAGSDSNPYDGLVTVSVSTLFACTGRVNWGRV